MTAQRVDLKKLLLLIKDGKDFDANLCLDEGCTLEAEDTTPLIKVFNYIINYMNQLTDKPLEISLDLRSNDYLLGFMAYTEQSDLPALSSNLQDVLKDYHASLEQVHEKGKYLQVKLSFTIAS
jgi:hypothetical protein